MRAANTTDPDTPDALFRPVMVLMSGRLLGFVAAFLIPVILARAFDQHEFGTYKQLFLIHATLFGVAQLGMAESLYYFLPNTAKRSGAYILNALLLMGGAGVLCALVLWWQRESIATLLNNADLIPYLPYLGLYLLFTLLGVVLEIVLTVRKQHVGASISYAGSDLVRAILFVVPVLWVADLGWLMTGAVAFALIRLCVTFLYMARAKSIELSTDRLHLRKHLAYALPFGLAGFIEILQLNFHMYAVSYYFDAATFAIYAVGCLQVPLIDILNSSTSNVMMINMRHRVLNEDHQAALAIWLDSVRKVSFILFPLVSLLLLVAPLLIVLLFGESYAASVPVFMVWTASTLLVCLLTDGVLRVFAQNRYLIFQNVLRLIIVAAFIRFFIDRFQLIGAVLVTTTSALLIKVMALHRVSVLLKASWSNLLPWRSQALTALACVLAAIPCIVVSEFLVLPKFVLLVLISVIFLLCYVVLIFVMGPLTRGEKMLMLAWVSTPIMRYRTNS